MAKASWTGPVISLGPLAGPASGSQPQENSLELGPSLFYQGSGFLDPRGPASKDNPAPGSMFANMIAGPIKTLDCTPGASNASVATGTPATAGIALPLTTTGNSSLAPLTPFAVGGNIISALGFDIGFTTIGVTNGSATATCAANDLWRFYPGQWLAIGSFGPSATNATGFAQVLAVGTYASPTLTLSVKAQQTSANSPVGMTNQVNPAAYGNPAPTAYLPRLPGGIGSFLDPRQCVMRGVSALGVAGSTGGNILITGIDCYNNLQSETITLAAGANTVPGNKTYKGLISAVPQFVDASHAYTIRNNDLFGFPLFSSEWEEVVAFYNGSLITGVAVTTAAAWIAGDQTSPASPTTKDPRGAIQVSARGPNTTVTSTTYPNGSIRLTVFQNVGLAAMLASNQFTQAMLYGVPPA